MPDKARRCLRALRRDRSGNSFIEMAVSLPVLLTLGLFGTEVAHMATVNMQVSQIATSLADNAARLGQTDNSSVTPTVTEAEVDSVMEGALQQGSGLNILENGRMIVSSLERQSSTGRQYIHWQRCRGSLNRPSAYGTTGAGLNGAVLQGMGPTGSRITSGNGSAVMFVEVFFDYQGLFGEMFIDNMTFKQEAAFEIRDDRNLGPGVTGSGGSSQCL